MTKIIPQKPIAKPLKGTKGYNRLFRLVPDTLFAIAEQEEKDILIIKKTLKK
jgi:hypothetical protein